MIKKPEISPQALLARDAVVCGDVRVAAGANIWFHATVRAESAPITIDTESNIQDNCVLHTDEGFPLRIGKRVTVGHGTVLHGCMVEDDALIGMGSVVLNGAQIGRGCVIGAGSLVTQNTRIPDGSMAFGRPAKVVRQVRSEELQANLDGVAGYCAEAEDYRRQGLLVAGDTSEGENSYKK